MRDVLRWVIAIAAGVIVIGLMAYARGDKHHRGDEIGTHGTKIVVVHVVP